MWDFHVDVVENEGKTKHRYSFTVQGHWLCYDAYHKYERENTTSTWSHDWPDAPDYSDWCLANNEVELDDWELERYGYPEAYQKLCNSLNGCMRKTSDGRACYGGSSGGKFKESHPLPTHVPALAKLALIDNIKVEGLNGDAFTD